MLLSSKAPSKNLAARGRRWGYVWPNFYEVNEVHFAVHYVLRSYKAYCECEKFFFAYGRRINSRHQQARQTDDGDRLQWCSLRGRALPWPHKLVKRTMETDYSDVVFEAGPCLGLEKPWGQIFMALASIPMVFSSKVRALALAMVLRAAVTIFLASSSNSRT